MFQYEMREQLNTLLELYPKLQAAFHSEERQGSVLVYRISIGTKLGSLYASRWRKHIDFVVDFDPTIFDVPASYVNGSGEWFITI